METDQPSCAVRAAVGLTPLEEGQGGDSKDGTDPDQES